MGVVGTRFSGFGSDYQPRAAVSALWKVFLLLLFFADARGRHVFVEEE